MTTKPAVPSKNHGGRIDELEDALFKMLRKATDISRELELLCVLKAAAPERAELLEISAAAGRLTTLCRANETVAIATLEAHSKESSRLLVELMATERRAPGVPKPKAPKGSRGPHR